MNYQVEDDGWRIPDELWDKIEPLLPPGKPHPLGCHRRRVPNRAAMDAIFFVLRTGCQWNALNATGICHCSSAHRRFQEWTEAGVFQKLWEQGLLEYAAKHGIEWDWQAMDGAMTKAPLGGEKNRAKSHRPGEDRHEAQRFDGWWRHTARCRDRRSEHSGLQAGA
jgi:transposase